MYGRIMITILLAAALTACATTTDPRKGGLFGGLHGLSSGDYEARLRQRQEELARQQNVNRELQDQSKALESEVQAKDRILATEQQRVIKMEEDLSRLESEVNSITTKSAQQRKGIAAVRGQIEDLRRRLRSQQSALSELDRAEGSATNPERYRILEKERDRLAEEYRRLLEYSQTLSGAAN